MYHFLHLINEQIKINRLLQMKCYIELGIRIDVNSGAVFVLEAMTALLILC